MLVAALVIGLLSAATGYWLANGIRPSQDPFATGDRIGVPVSQNTGDSLSLNDALARCSMPIPDRFRLNLLEAGYVVREDEKISDVSLPFGGSIKIPVREVKIEYRGIDTYQ